MSSKMDSLVIRFPDGTKEFRYPGRDLVEGDHVFHDGTRFRVISVSRDGGRVMATVEADSSFGDLLRSEEGAIRLELANGA